jgi:hypothetical protein
LDASIALAVRVQIGHFCVFRSGAFCRWDGLRTGGFVKLGGDSAIGALDRGSQPGHAASDKHDL